MRYGITGDKRERTRVRYKKKREKKKKKKGENRLGGRGEWREKDRGRASERCTRVRRTEGREKAKENAEARMIHPRWHEITHCGIPSFQATR